MAKQCNDRDCESPYTSESGDRHAQKRLIIYFSKHAKHYKFSVKKSEREIPPL